MSSRRRFPYSGACRRHDLTQQPRPSAGEERDAPLTFVRRGRAERDESLMPVVQSRKVTAAGGFWVASWSMFTTWYGLVTA